VKPKSDSRLRLRHRRARASAGPVQPDPCGRRTKAMQRTREKIVRCGSSLILAVTRRARSQSRSDGDRHRNRNQP
jgi:hypothetical protein